jgi:hypothetical protein
VTARPQTDPTRISQAATPPPADPTRISQAATPPPADPTRISQAATPPPADPTRISQAATPPPADPTRISQAAGDDLQVWFRSVGGLAPDVLEIGLRGGRRPRVEAYWDGCLMAMT